jgi:8-oxo-dGTP diphosphatase
MKLLMHSNEKYSYLAEVIGGELFLDSKIECNQEILEIAWIDLDNHARFDFVTSPLLDLYLTESV